MKLINRHGQPLTIWYFSPHDRTPYDSWGYDRAEMQIEQLTSAGCKVLFFASTFSHSTKLVRGPAWKRSAFGNGMEVILVPVRQYSRHASLARFAALFDFAWNIWRHKHEGVTPDVIISVMPTPFVDIVSVWLARRYKAKFIQDFRDLWPELFVHAFPSQFRIIANLFIQPLKWMRTWSLKRADGFISVTNEYLNFAAKISKSVLTRPHDVIYFGVNAHRPNSRQIDADQLLLLNKRDSKEKWFVYGGTLGENYDIRTMVNVFLTLSNQNPDLNLHLKIAGNGPLRELVLAAAKSSPERISYLGPLDKNELWTLLNSSDVGLLPYAKFSTVSVPAKTFDYIAANLPIINSLPGEIEEIITKNGIGVNYISGDENDLRRAVLELASDSDRLLQMRQRSAVVAPKYSATVQYGKLIDLIAKTLS